MRWDVQLKTQSCATLTAAGISNSGKVPRDPKGVEFALICMMKLANSFARHVTRGRLRYVVTRQSKYNEGKTVQTKETRSPFKEEEEEEGGGICILLHIICKYEGAHFAFVWQQTELLNLPFELNADARRFFSVDLVKGFIESFRILGFI